MSHLPLRYVFCCTLTILFLFGGAQDRKSLERKRNALDEQIKTVSNLLAATKNDQRASQADLSLLDKQIALQQDLLRTVKAESRRTQKQIDETENGIQVLKTQLDELKESYGKMVHYAYRNRSSYDRLSYIFAAESFAQAYRRSRYLNQLATFRQRQAELITESTTELEAKRADLEVQKKEKITLLKKQEQETVALQQTKKKQEALLAQLREKADELQQDLKKKQSVRSSLDKKIRELIAEEIRKSKANNKGTFSLTPEALELSNKFNSNKGRLPWPVERGVVISRFGRQAHPVLKGIQIENNGVDIATESNTTLRAVFDGTVSSVFLIPGAGKVVIVEHGAYRTVYSPMKEVYVQKGDKVNTKQALGILLSEGNDNHAHFELWRISAEGPAKEDPASWLFPQ